MILTVTGLRKFVLNPFTHPFNKFRVNGKEWIAFVVSLSHHKCTQRVQYLHNAILFYTVKLITNLSQQGKSNAKNNHKAPDSISRYKM